MTLPGVKCCPKLDLKATALVTNHAAHSDIWKAPMQASQLLARFPLRSANPVQAANDFPACPAFEGWVVPATGSDSCNGPELKGWP